MEYYENNIINNHIYEYKITVKNQNGTIYIECKDKLKEQCKARGKIVQGQIIWTRRHSHYNNERNIAIREMKQDLYEAVISTLDDFRKIYDRISVLHVNAAHLVTFTSVESSMRRWRQKCRPPIPCSLGSYVEIINLQKWEHFRKYTGVDLNVSCVIAEDFSVAAVIADPQFLRQLDIKEFYIDATFKVCPRKLNIYQLLTIMGRVRNVVIPITWAFMERKTHDAYVAVLKKFKILTPHLDPSVITIDFEQGLSSAITRVFPAATIHRCYFHHIQAIMRRLNKKGKGFIERLKNWDEGLKFYRKLIGIALLPAGDIPAAYNWLIQNATSDILHEFKDIIDYYKSWWLNTVTPIKFNVFKNVHKTTNEIEAYHRVLLKRVGEHPSIWQITLHLLQLKYVTMNEHRSIMVGLTVRRPIENRLLIKKEIIMRAWILYEQKLLDIPRFLAAANHFSLVFNNRQLIKNATGVDYFTYAPIHNINIHLLRPQALELTIIDDDVNRMPILRPTLNDHDNVHVVLLHQLQLSKCMLCQTKITNYVSVSCWHWLACENCTFFLKRLALTKQADLRCPTCTAVCMTFKKILIT